MAGDPRPSSGSGWRARALRTAQSHVPLVVLIGATFILSWIAVRMVGRPEAVTLTMYSGPVYWLTALFLVGFAVVQPLWTLARVRPARPVAYLVEDWRRRILAPERVIGAALVLLSLPVFMSAFSGVKMSIPAFRPFTWDPTLATWDRVLHLGRHPWEWLHPLTGSPAVTSAISVLYQTWFFVTFAVVLWQAFSAARAELRMRFLLTYVLIWVLLGNVLAIVMSSAGPVYYGRVTGLDDPYLPFMEHLRSVAETLPVFVLRSQELLWTVYSSDGQTVGGGISAMPSMHVASTFLATLVCWRTSRILGVLMAAYLGAILIGSIVMGWHYALDGYVAIPLTALIWWAVGRWTRTREWPPDPAAAEPPGR